MSEGNAHLALLLVVNFAWAIFHWLQIKKLRRWTEELSMLARGWEPKDRRGNTSIWTNYRTDETAFITHESNGRSMTIYSKEEMEHESDPGLR